MVQLFDSVDDAVVIAMASGLGPNYMETSIRDAIIGLLKDRENVEARDILRTAISSENISDYDSEAYLSTLVLIHAGDVDFVFDLTIADGRKYSFGNVESIWSPIYAPFRQHPRFGEYLELLNLPEYWDQAGWPDICQRNEDGRVECQ